MTSDLTSSLSQKRDHTGANIKLEILGIINRNPIWDLDIRSLSKKTGTYGARIPSPPYIKKYSSLKRRGSNTTFVIVNEGRFSLSSPKNIYTPSETIRMSAKDTISHQPYLESLSCMSCLVFRCTGAETLEEVREGNHQIILQDRGGIPDPVQTIWWLQVHVPI